MDKSRLLGWMLIFGIILVWFEFKKKEAIEQQELEKASKKTVATKEKREPTKPHAALEPNDNEAPQISQEAVSSGSLKPDSVSPDTQVIIPERNLWVITNNFKVGIKSQGASINSVQLKPEGEKDHNNNYELINPDSIGIAGIMLGNVDLTQKNWLTQYSGPDTIFVSDRPFQLGFLTKAGQDTLRRIYTFYPDSHLVSHKFVSKQNVSSKFHIIWASGMKESEAVPSAQGIGLGANFFSEVVINYGEQNVSRLKPSERETYNEESGVLKWVGLRRKYTAAIINFNDEKQYQVGAIPLSEADNADWPTFSLEITGADYENGSLDFDLVFFTLKHSEIKKHKQGYQKILFSGYSWFLGADSWYPKLCGLVLNVLNKFYNLIPNYGIAIILLTLLVRFILLPLTITQTKAMAKQQELAPELKELREKYKGDTQKMFAAQRELYKEKGVNQAAALIGCLPMLLQFPVFISLFNVLGRAVELKGAGFFGWINDLSSSDVILESIKIPFIFPMGLTVLPFFMAITMYYQTKLTITDPKQKPMVIMMPIMMFIFSASFPSGLVLYWTVSNVFTIAQTAVMKKNKKVSQVPESKGKLSANVVSKKKNKRK